jgi:hypothetical protein
MFQKLKKNEYFCIFLSLPSFCRCFAEFYETLFSGPRRVVHRDEFYNIDRNVHDQEKDGYSDIVDEMQVTAGCSSTVLIDAEGAGLLENSS